MKDIQEVIAKNSNLWTRKEAERINSHINRHPTLSEGAKFIQSLAGFELFYKGKKVDRWELWALGYRSVSNIINNFYPEIIAK